PGVEAIDITAAVEFGEGTRLDKVGRLGFGKFHIPFSQMINHGLNGALNSERFGRHVRSVMPRFLQRLGIAGAEKLCKDFVRVLTPGFEEMNAPNQGTRCAQRKIRVVFIRERRLAKVEPWYSIFRSERFTR